MTDKLNPYPLESINAECSANFSTANTSYTRYFIWGGQKV